MDQGTQCMQTLCGQSIPAVSDIHERYKENMDKTEAQKVPGAEGRSWLWGFLPKGQQSVNSLSNVTKVQLQDVIRRAEVGLFRGQPLEQKETVHTIKNTQKNSWKEAHISGYQQMARVTPYFKQRKPIPPSKIFFNPLQKKSSIPNVFSASSTKKSSTHKATTKEQHIL